MIPSSLPIPRRSPRSLTLSLCLAAACAGSILGAGSGCSPDFVPYNRLTSLRVLGVQSEPPSPISGEEATLSALVYVPPGEPQPRYTWSWCPFTGPSGDGYPCGFNGTPLTDASLTALLEQARAGLGLPPGKAPPPLSLGSDPTAHLGNTLEPEILATFCRGTLAGILPTNCSDGFPFRIKLTVEIDGEHSDRLDVVFTTRWRYDQSMADNANPLIDGIFVTRDQMSREINDQPEVTLPRDIQTAVVASVSPEAAESYVGTDENGKTASLRERLFITWFVETGDVDDSSTSFIDGRTSFEDLQRNYWTPGLKKSYAPDLARLYTVIHDSRGGVSWKSAIVNLETTP